MPSLRRFLTVGVLEVYALLLVWLRLPGGVLTDEAKYLLSIPYPHPPALRFLMGMTASWPLHEFLWRALIASIVVQAVWIVRDLGSVLPKPRRDALILTWLLSAAVILQAGTVVLSVISAVFGLLFLWFALRPTSLRNPSIIGLLWLFGIFTAYQTVLYLPLVFIALRKSVSLKKTLFFCSIPLILLTLYTATNPLILATFAKLSTQDTALPWTVRGFQVLSIWLVAGSFVSSVAGTVGILMSGRRELVATFGLVLGYVFLTSQHYYAILLTPVLLGGVYLLLCRRRLPPGLFIAAHTLATLVVVVTLFPDQKTTSARTVLRSIAARGIMGGVIVSGPFGHEWQYESLFGILRYSPRLALDVEHTAGAFVCTKASCDEEVNPETWTRLLDMPLPTWVRK